MYEVPSNRPPVRTLPRRRVGLRALWLLATSLAAMVMAGSLVDHDLSTLGVRPSPRPFLVPEGSSVILFGLTFILVNVRAWIMTRHTHPPIRSARWWLLVGFWVLVGSMSILLGVLAVAEV